MTLGQKFTAIVVGTTTTWIWPPLATVGNGDPPLLLGFKSVCCTLSVLCQGQKQRHVPGRVPKPLTVVCTERKSQ